MSNASKNFQDKLTTAKETLQQLMNPEITLETSVKAYKEGMETLKEAQKLLDDAKLEYETIRENLQTK